MSKSGRAIRPQLGLTVGKKVTVIANRPGRSCRVAARLSQIKSFGETVARRGTFFPLLAASKKKVAGLVRLLVWGEAGESSKS